MGVIDERVRNALSGFLIPISGAGWPCNQIIYGGNQVLMGIGQEYEIYTVFYFFTFFTIANDKLKQCTRCIRRVFRTS